MKGIGEIIKDRLLSTPVGQPLRKSRNRVHKLFSRVVAKEEIREGLRKLGLSEGSTVVVHSSLRSFGKIQGGADAVVDAIIESVGPRGTIMMPTYPFNGSMLEYVLQKKVFDFRSTPSQTGSITEAFRKRRDVMRDLHPTHPMVCWGPQSEYLLGRHEEQETPMGQGSPYQKIEEMENSYNLLLGVRYLTVHSLQERVDWPNTFLKEEYETYFVDRSGRERTVLTKVHNPAIADLVIVETDELGSMTLVDMRYWILQHPSSLVRKEQHKRGFQYFHPMLLERQRYFLKEGIIRFGTIGKCEATLIELKPFIERIEGDLLGNRCRYLDKYLALTKANGSHPDQCVPMPRPVPMSVVE